VILKDECTHCFIGYDAARISSGQENSIRKEGNGKNARICELKGKRLQNNMFSG
jgi:hypothetical protein